MSRKILPILLLLAIFLSACGNQETPVPEIPTETSAPPTETLVPTSTPIPEATLTPTPSEEPTTTATPLPPENAADCTNAAKFIDDVTIPDNSNVNTNESFTKTWRVQNTGTCIWYYGYTLAHYSELSFGAQESVELPLTNPGEVADISVDLIAPSVAGLYRGNFVIRNPEGLPMEIEGDSRLWIIFNAIDSGLPQPSPTTAPTENADSTEPTAEPTSEGTENTEAPQACTYTVEPERAQAVLDEINAYRAESGLPAYPFNDQLNQAAQVHAADMSCNRLFTHTGSDGSTLETRVANAGYTGNVSENVYGSYPPLSPAEVTDWWRFDQTDPNHNLNLVSTQYTEVGIGYAFFNKFGYYVVVFGAP